MRRRSSVARRSRRAPRRRARTALRSASPALVRRTDRERARIGLGPERQQSAMLGCRQPTADLSRHRGESDAQLSRGRTTKPVQQLELVDPRTGQQRADERVLAVEQIQQHPRAGPDRRGERTQRHVGKPVLEHVPVRELEEICLSLRAGLGRWLSVNASVTCVVCRTETVVSVDGGTAVPDWRTERSTPRSSAGTPRSRHWWRWVSQRTSSAPPGGPGLRLRPARHPARARPERPVRAW